MAFRDLADGKIALYVPRHADARAIVDCEDELIRRWWNQSQPVTLSVARERVRTAKRLHDKGAADGRLTMRRVDEPRLIGWLRVHACEAIGETPSDWRGPPLAAAAREPGAELEMWLCPRERGGGNGTRAKGIACRFAFDVLGVPWVKGEIQPENSASFTWPCRSLASSPRGEVGR